MAISPRARVQLNITQRYNCHLFTVIIIVTIVGSIHTELHWFLGCRAQGWLWRDVLEGRWQVLHSFITSSQFREIWTERGNIFDVMFLNWRRYIVFSSFHCLKVPRQLERRPAPRKGRVSGPEFKTEAKNDFHWNLFNLEVFVPRSGQMETSLWASSKPVFPVERAFMRPNPETSLSEGWKGFKIKLKF